MIGYKMSREWEHPIGVLYFSKVKLKMLTFVYDISSMPFPFLVIQYS